MAVRPNNSEFRRSSAKRWRHPLEYLRTSVHGKLVGVILLSTITALLIAGTAMLMHDLSVYRSSWVNGVASEANMLALSTAPALGFDDRETAQRNLAALERRPAILAAALYTVDDQLYASYSRAGQPPPPAQPPKGFEGTRILGEQVELVQPVRYQNEYLGTLYLLAYYDVWGRVRAYLGIFSLITVASLASAFLLSAIVRRAITDPLEQIGEVASRIVHEQDYSLRVNQSTSDEIGLAVQALNRMLNEIQSRTQALQHSNAALQDADRRKDEFLATLAHELRNPLAPIRHATRILDAPGANESQRKWSREVIARQVEQMALLLEDLLDVSRITRGRLGLKKDYVSLDQIVHSAVETARPLIEAKHHSLEVRLPTERTELHVDPLRIAQALSNLLTNAAKYTDAGGSITLFAERDSAGVSIGVTDTGIGLEQSSIPKVFEMFSQVESALERSQGGLGIGLALVKGLVTLHGGSVEVKSPGKGKGSTFTVRLPNACVVQQLLAARPNDTAAPPPGGPVCRVLVADDNRDGAESLSLLLQVSGYDVVVAYSGSQALELARRQRPDACILDVGMPELTGYEVARAIREEVWGQDALLIALTGWGQREDVERSREAGFDRHFTKPVDAIRIEEVLKAFCIDRVARLGGPVASPLRA